MDKWARLAAAVKARREEELGITQEEVAARGGPSSATQYQIETAGRKSYRWSTLRGLESALDWPPGTVRAILANRPRPPATSPEDVHATIRAWPNTAKASPQELTDEELDEWAERLLDRMGMLLAERRRRRGL